ncbi:acyl carrier protein [Streptomyces sp. NBC_01381]|uniref:acyl carrier protein n=1 Tax=unclassified Streptomyces TaxID=2593676 RepID=UPI0022583B25|nr:acyl carrier protein [Streptomyces sp. NBC_01381]MCX4670928.1 acyl carrier protein [Streptomyces sp. NBC_01381]
MTSVYEDEAVRSRVLEYLLRYVDDPSELEGMQLITGGVLNSLATVSLVGHLEKEFGVEVEDDDLEIENFDTVDSIVRFVQGKQA